MPEPVPWYKVTVTLPRTILICEPNCAPLNESTEDDTAMPTAPLLGPSSRDASATEAPVQLVVDDHEEWSIQHCGDTMTVVTQAFTLPGYEGRTGTSGTI
jgi:hypothetical protein